MPEPAGEPELLHEKEQLVNNKVKAEKRKRSPTAEDINHTEGTSVKKKRTVERGELNEEPFPMNVKTEIRNGVRYLAPYWAAYRANTKGRWVGRKIVDVFTQEFLSLNKFYPKVACKLGRFFVNGKQMLDVDYVLKNGDTICHWGHRHEHPPPSLPVHACGQYAIHTVLGQLRYNHDRHGLRVLHRLDRTTSGVLMFAKNYETDLEFKKTLKNGNWSKEYVCMVEGEFPDEEIECNEPIDVLVVTMGIQCVRQDGKTAHSRFKKIWSDGKRSVLSVNITTGRTHQIRVHAQFLGFPIVGDQIYNSTAWGITKGKNAQYGKSYEELCKDVRAAHCSSNWHETVDPQYEAKMERMANEELVPEPADLQIQDRPAYDPICLNCNVIKKEVPAGHFQLYLHCLKYSTDKWSYSTPLPDWAIQPQTVK
uniref:Pseudouridine synthase domain containing protein n=1 Tax=Haemonchus contortus TaxID=6289 RepID=W6NBY7_HAECO